MVCINYYIFGAMFLGSKIYYLLNNTSTELINKFNSVLDDKQKKIYEEIKNLRWLMIFDIRINRSPH